MKKVITLLVAMFATLLSFGQEEAIKKEKDTIIKTEVVEVVTSYAPKVTDAFKIKRKPIIKLSKDVAKKKLEYQIQSAPVASTFVPKSGTMKKIDIGKRELIYNNYIAIGFGNNITPLFEGYFHKNTPFDSEYGINAKFIMSIDPVNNTQLSSSYYNAHLDGFFKQEERYFTWKAGFNADRNKYNWYGLPANINFTDATLSYIEPEQVYKNYSVFGELEFPESYIKNGKASIGYFSDIFNSTEFEVDINSLFSFPLGRVGVELNDIFLGVSANFLGGGFERNYTSINEKKYSFATAGINPHYKFSYANFDIKLGAKGYFSMNLETSKNDFLIYPDVSISYPIISKFANLYAGAKGDLRVNSFKQFANENPYISPTINLARSNEQFSFFGGLKGILSGNINYNVMGSYSKEENKPLFTLHKSKSNGNTTGNPLTGFSYRGYEYGNSFDVAYDDTNTIQFNGEIEYTFSKNLNLGLSAEYNQYSLSQQEEAWNLPQLTANIFGKYKTNKWYASANVYFVGERKGIVYNATTTNTVDLKSYIDINVNGGYHFNPILSAFVKVNNATSGEYQRFNSFNAQSIQVIGGIIWKFDTLF